MSEQKFYIAVDLKSFFASVECVDRGLEPLNTNLVVADAVRTEKTICLAVTPSLKSYGVSGRPRLFELIKKVNDVNHFRVFNTLERMFKGESYFYDELQKDPYLSVAYICAQPRMARYLYYSSIVYSVYLKYFSIEDIHIYSIDEVFIDVTSYLSLYKKTPKEVAVMVVNDICDTTGITATAGIGTNMYLCKVAMDIVAKHMEPDENGARVAQLDVASYRRMLWGHKPLSDFWRVGKASEKKLAVHGIFTMGDIVRATLASEYERVNTGLLYKILGVNAGLLIEHAWGFEECTIQAIKQYRPVNTSLSSGQVLHCPYSFQMAKTVVHEMMDNLSLTMVEKGVVTNQIVLVVEYDIDNLKSSNIANIYKDKIVTDSYGRKKSKHARGTININHYTSSSVTLVNAVMKLYDDIVDKILTVRKLNICVNNIKIFEPSKDYQNYNENELYKKTRKRDNGGYVQLDIFEDYEELDRKKEKKKEQDEKIRKQQKAMLAIKNKYSKNALLKANSLTEGATLKSRNEQIGGHKA